MVELDGYVGQLLKKLDDLGVADNTIVVFTTDNGAEVMSWPDGGTTPFRGEKATNWEGGFAHRRVHLVPPGTIKPGTAYNEMFSHYDLIPTFAAAGGDPDIVAKLLHGAQIGNKTFKVHLDGYNLMPFLKGDARSRRATSSSIGMTTANWSPYATTIGKPSSWNKTTRASVYGKANSPTCACQNFSTCDPIRSSEATNQFYTTNGWQIAPSFKCLYRRSLQGGLKASRSSHRDRSQRVSILTR